MNLHLSYTPLWFHKLIDWVIIRFVVTAVAVHVSICRDRGTTVSEPGQQNQTGSFPYSSALWKSTWFPGFVSLMLFIVLSQVTVVKDCYSCKRSQKEDDCMRFLSHIGWCLRGIQPRTIDIITEENNSPKYEFLRNQIHALFPIKPLYHLQCRCGVSLCVESMTKQKSLLKDFNLATNCTTWKTVFL